MALLIVEHHGTRRMAPLARRILIGRRSGNHVVINDRAVAMVHAWIDKRGEECVLTDTGSRTGTLVNGKRITRPLPLVDGDVITVGPATLTFDANGEATLPEPAAAVRGTAGDDPLRTSTVPEAAPVPTAALPPAVAPPPPTVTAEPTPAAAPAAAAAHAAHRVDSSADGWLFDCACGAPLWAGASFAGRTAYCRYCGREVRVPHSAAAVAGAAATDAATGEFVPAAAAVGSVSPVSNDVAEPAAATAHSATDVVSPDTTSSPEPASRFSPENEAEPVPEVSPTVESPSPPLPLSLQMSEQPVQGVMNDERAKFETSPLSAERPAQPDPGADAAVDEPAPVAAAIFSGDLSEAITQALERSDTHAPPPPNIESAPTSQPQREPEPEHAPATAPVQASAPTAAPEPAEIPALAGPRVAEPMTMAEPGPLPLSELSAITTPIIEAKPEPVPAARVAEPRPVAPALTTTASASAMIAPAPAPPPIKPAPAPARDRAAETPPPAKPKVTPLKATRTCGICQSGILFNEKTTTCPSCGLTFHAECWVENRGCSAYGCPQVGILDAKKPGVADEEAHGDDDAAVAAEAEAVEREAAKAYSVKAPMPWEHLTLAASAICLLVSVLTFGVPSLIVGAGTMIYLSRKPGVRRKTGILLLSTAIALVGFIVGLMASWFFWFDRGWGGGGGHRP